MCDEAGLCWGAWQHTAAAGLSEAEATAAHKLELELLFAERVKQTSHHCLALLKIQIENKMQSLRHIEETLFLPV